MALVNGDYKFSWVDVGSNGSAGDAQVFNCSELKQYIEEERLGIPAAEPLPHDDRDMPYFIVVADDAFALRTWLMKPFSKRLQLSTVQVPPNRRKCIWNSSSPLPVPLHNHVTDTTNSGVNSFGMYLPT